MMIHVSCILFLIVELSTTSTSKSSGCFMIAVPYAQKDPHPIHKEVGSNPGNSLVSTINGSALPQYCMEEHLC